MLGYEGYIKVGGAFVLGTGSSVQRTRPKIESSGGYAGTINGTSGRGVGAPRTYDWEYHEGSVNFELTTGVVGVLKGWLAARQTGIEIELSSRNSNSQLYNEAFWSSISMSAAEGSAADGSAGFVAMVRDSYTYGSDTVSATGAGVIAGALSPNVNPIPFWNTSVSLASSDFLSWSIDLSQDVVRLFICGASANPAEPAYLAVGPMSATFSGTMLAAPTGVDTSGTITIGGSSITMNKMELQTSSDDVQTGDAFTPVSVEYAVYEVS